MDELAKSTAFPFVGSAVTLLRGVVKLETERRANSGRCRALILQITDMMGALLQLRNVKDPELETDGGETMVGRIDALMKKIEVNITECGNLIDLYHRHHFFSMWFHTCCVERFMV